MSNIERLIKEATQQITEIEAVDRKLDDCTDELAETQKQYRDSMESWQLSCIEGEKPAPKELDKLKDRIEQLSARKTALRRQLANKCEAGGIVAKDYEAYWLQERERIASKFRQELQQARRAFEAVKSRGLTLEQILEVGQLLEREDRRRYVETRDGHEIFESVEPGEAPAELIEWRRLLKSLKNLSPRAQRLKLQLRDDEEPPRRISAMYAGLFRIPGRAERRR